MYSADLIVVNDWGAGFTAKLIIENLGSEAITWSQIEFDAPFKISHLWNGQILNEDGGLYVVANADWNKAILPKSQIEIGFNGIKIDDSDSVQINSLVLDAFENPNSSSEISSEVYLAVLTTEESASVKVLGDKQSKADATSSLKLPNPINDELAVDSAQTAVGSKDSPAVSEHLISSDSNSDSAISFEITNDWGNGFVANVTVRNQGLQVLNGWELSFRAPFEIQNIWGAQFTKASANAFEFTPADWNQKVLPGGSITFGFVGAKDPGSQAIPRNYQFNGTKVDLPLPKPAPLPTVTTDSASVQEQTATSENSVDLQVMLSEASEQIATVDYKTKDGSAIAGEDYIAKNGTLSFSPGETTKLVKIKIINDEISKPTETFELNLSNPLKATLGEGRSAITILDDDNPSAPQPPSDDRLEEPTSSPLIGAFNYGEALQKSFLFYEAQRSGALPQNNRIDWRHDSALNDGADVGLNLSGGYYDAGDHVKFGFPMAYSMTMLSWGVEQYRQAYQSIGQLDEALDAIRWGTDYILRAHVTDGETTKAFWGQVGDGNTDHSYWGAPEDMKMARPAFKVDAQNPGTDLAAEAAAALSAASIIFRPTDAAYADELLANAKQLYTFADTYRGRYSDTISNAQSFYNSWSGYQDELAWGAAWLYKATGDSDYLQKAESVYQTQIGGLNPGWTLNWDDKSYGAAVLLAQQTGSDQYEQDVENWLNSWVTGSNGVQKTAGGMRWISQWGSLRYAANTAFVAGVYADTIDDPNGNYSNLAETTMDYLLGKNPRGASYVVGFGDDSPLQPHHRAAHGGTWSNFNSPAPNDHMLYGALVGGPNEASDFAYEDSRSNYITNEVALDYNAAYTGAIARMVDNFGGDPLNNAELAALPGITVFDAG